MSDASKIHDPPDSSKDTGAFRFSKNRELFADEIESVCRLFSLVRLQKL